MEQKRRNMGRASKRLIDSLPITALKLEAQVVDRARPNPGSTVRKRVLERNGRKYLIVHSKQIGSVLCLVESFCNDHGDAVADMSDEISCQNGPQWSVITCACWQSWEARTRQILDVFCNNIFACENA
jgi:hypothetical protein